MRLQRYSPTDEKENVIYYRHGHNELISLIQFLGRIIIFIQKLKICLLFFNIKYTCMAIYRT